MNTKHTRTLASIQAQSRREADELLERQKARMRFDYDQERRKDNRVILFCGVMLAVLTSLMTIMVGEAIAQDKAMEGKIYAKSEMTRAEIKQLNVMPTHVEKHGAKK